MIISITKLKEIPKTCSECPYVYYGRHSGNEACCAKGFVYEIKNTNISTERWAFCPLIKVNNNDISKIIEGGNK